jgi:hypothetical protein
MGGDWITYRGGARDLKIEYEEKRKRARASTDITDPMVVLMLVANLNNSSITTFIFPSFAIWSIRVEGNSNTCTAIKLDIAPGAVILILSYK